MRLTMSESNIVVIKKYPNRRLYNTKLSKYITIEEISEYVRKEINFKVIDVKTEEDLTRITLAQIILDHELKGYELIPTELIKLMIKFYNHPMSKFFEESLKQNTKFYQDMLKANETMDYSKFNISEGFNQLQKMNEMFFDVFNFTKKK